MTGTLIRRWNEDKFQLLILAGARLPKKLVRSGSLVIRRTFGAKYVSAQVLSNWLAGDRIRAVVLADRVAAASPRLNARHYTRLAEVLLAMGESSRAENSIEIARKVQTGQQDARAIASASARLKWHKGDMTGAINDIRAQTLAGRWAQRLAEEKAIFSGWRPTLETHVNYQPQRGTVLHVLTNSVPHTQSGYALRSHEILRAQAQAGLEVHAVTRIGYPALIGRIDGTGRQTIDGVTYHRLVPFSLPSSPTERLQEQARQLRQLCLELQPSILHTTTHFTNALAVESVAQSLGIPWIYEVRGFLFDTWASSREEYAYTSEKYRLFMERESEMAHRADAVITLGEAMSMELQRWGIPIEKISLVPNSVSRDDVAIEITPSEARARLGMEDDKFYVGSISSIVDYEGIDFLLDAVARLATTHKNLRLMVVGDGSARDSLLEQASCLGIQNISAFPGRVDLSTAKLYYQALDLFVVPRRDTRVTRLVTPLKSVLAQATGLNVIGSNLPALWGLGRENLFEAESVPALAKKIAEFLATPTYRVLKQAPTWDDAARTTATLYQDLEGGLSA